MNYEKKIKEIIEHIEDAIMREKENIADCKRTNCYNTVGHGMAEGALEAYSNILEIINNES